MKKELYKRYQEIPYPCLGTLILKKVHNVPLSLHAYFPQVLEVRLPNHPIQFGPKCGTLSAQPHWWFLMFCLKNKWSGDGKVRKRDMMMGSDKKGKGSQRERRLFQEDYI